MFLDTEKYGKMFELVNAPTPNIQVLIPRGDRGPLGEGAIRHD